MTLWTKSLVGLAVVGIAIQFVPFGHQHTNPAVTKEPSWDSPETRELFKRACFDCHTNVTTWPWYSNVAPVSWLVQRDVNGGRRHLNFTEWDKPQRHAKDIGEQVLSGGMPPWFYLPMHPNAKLSSTDKAALIAGAEKTFGAQAGPERSPR
jgi:mono/diheme cytochrome c family protein